MGIQNSESLVSSSSKIKFEESDESEYSSEEEEIKRELADVSFEDLQKSRSNGFMHCVSSPKKRRKGG
ncbi:hypothetical protein AQUCO_10600001v1 [Aquilegia coerulea]|uniref:Uncharacterized protein n=1 Tax=Aquilegia coerulea TaxID=218851 RepID=A0A2G5C3I4_AQUCA|nr:hypothetical protein AQUCO_10600001v1 [Aquilegia coerulea]